MPGPTVYRFTNFIGAAKSRRKRESLLLDALIRGLTLCHAKMSLWLAESSSTLARRCSTRLRQVLEFEQRFWKCCEDVTRTARNECISWHPFCPGVNSALSGPSAVLFRAGARLVPSDLLFRDLGFLKEPLRVVISLCSLARACLGEESGRRLSDTPGALWNGCTVVQCNLAVLDV